MNRFSRFAAWLVIGLGALTTIATSRAPSAQLTGSFERALAPGETVHVTFHVSAPAMDHLRALGGSPNVRAQTTGNSFTLIPDGADAMVEVAVDVQSHVSIAEDACPMTGGCDLGLTLEGPESGADASTRVFVDLVVAGQDGFPAGSVIDAEED